MIMATSAPILLCAATKWEAEPLAAAFGLRRLGDFRFEGTVGGVDIVLLKTGIGAENARRALATISAAEETVASNFSVPKMLISVGFAGALQPKMDSGDLVLDVAGLDLSVPQTAREIAASQNTPIHFGRITHSDKVLFNPKDKAALGQSARAAAIDMESQAIRAAAERLGVSFLAARVVLDAVDERLPSAVPAGESLSDLIPFVLKNATELPLMLKVGLLQRSAITRLASFLKELLPRL
jgi:nucleoside phosphorylase